MVFNGSYPPGYRFCPTNEELVICYLRKKIMNLPLPCEDKIMNVNIYEFHPQQLQNAYKGGDKYMYFFSRRDRKYPQGDRPNRSTGEGFWKATGVDTVIRQNNIIIGTRKTLAYYEGKPKDHPVKTNWIMHEYRTIEQKDETSRETRKKGSRSSNSMMLDKCVLCRIYKRKTKRSRKKDDDTDSGSSTSSEPLMRSNVNGSEYVSDNVGSTRIEPHDHHSFYDFTNFAPPLVGGALQGSEPYYPVGSSSFMTPMQTTHNIGFGSTAMPIQMNGGSYSSVIPMRGSRYFNVGSSSSSVIPMRRSHNINAGSCSSSVIPMQRSHILNAGSSSSSVIPMQRSHNVNVGSSSSAIPMQRSHNINVGSSSYVTPFPPHMADNINVRHGSSATPMRMTHDPDNVGSASFFASQPLRTHEYPAPDSLGMNHPQMFEIQGNHNYFNALGCTNYTATQESNAAASVGSTSYMPTAMQRTCEPDDLGPMPSATAPPMLRIHDGDMQRTNEPDNVGPMPSATAPPMLRTNGGDMQDTNSSNSDEFDCLSFLNSDMIMN